MNDGVAHRRRLRRSEEGFERGIAGGQQGVGCAGKTGERAWRGRGERERERERRRIMRGGG
jgi:hypothetical protein